MDEPPAALNACALLGVPAQELAGALQRRYLAAAGGAYPADPCVAFDLWRALTFLLGRNRTPHRVFSQAAGSAVRLLLCYKGGFP